MPNVLGQLARFLSSHQRNTWLGDAVMQVYVRQGRHSCAGVILSTLDIASVTVFEPQQGTWTKFLVKAHAMNLAEATYIECVHNPHLRRSLERRGWLPSGQEWCYYLPTEVDDAS